MNQRPERNCPDCEKPSDSTILDAFGNPVSRRGFLKKVGGTAAAMGAAQLLPGVLSAHAAPSPKSSAETAVKALYDTFSDQQAAKICLPFDHQLRHRINANWKISKIAIGSDFYSNEQQDLITRGWLRICEVTGSGIPVSEYPLKPKVDMSKLIAERQNFNSQTNNAE